MKNPFLVLKFWYAKSKCFTFGWSL